MAGIEKLSAVPLSLPPMQAATVGTEDEMER